MPHLRSKKSKWTLALLALRGEREVARSWLAGTLWPESTEERALSALRTTLKDVRRALGTEAWRLSSPSTGTIRLDLASASVDVAAFDWAVKNGEDRAAVEIYRSYLLEDCAETWVLEERERRQVQALAAFESLARAAYQRAEFEQAESWSRRAVALDPLRESAVRLLMLACDAAGNSSAATDAYLQYRRTLRRELRCDPEGEIAILFARMRERAARAGLSPSRLAAPPPMEYVLPQPLTRLIGRESDLPQVMAQVRLNRLVTLTGSGGVGKTRLALEVSSRLASEFGWGACFVELAGISDPKLVSESILTKLGIRIGSGTTPVGALSRSLRYADLLLVLDNCEHLLDGCASLAIGVLEVCPGVRILATSREPLGITGEVQWRVPSLDLPQEDAALDKKDALESAMGSAALQLFVERAGQANSTFALSSASLPAAKRICRRLDGIPLALEMAAARVRTMSLEEVADGLDSRFELLTQGSRTALPRQQTLAATLEWGYALLDPKEQLLLCRLSVFAGGWFSSSAQEVCADAEIEATRIAKLIEALVQKSLVECRSDPPGTRFRLLESVREFARQRLEDSGDADWVRERHLAHFVDFVLKAIPFQFTPETGLWMERLRLEQENAWEALVWGQAAAERAIEADETDRAVRMIEQVLRLSGGYGAFWHRVAYAREGLDSIRRSLSIANRVIERLAPRAGSSDPVLAVEAALVRPIAYASYLCYQQSMPDEALRFNELEQELAVKVGDRFFEANALYGRGQILYDLERYEEMREALERSLSIGIEIGSLFIQTCANCWLGEYAWTQGDHEESERRHRIALALAEEGGIAARAHAERVWLAYHAAARGDAREAYDLAREGARGNVETGFLITFPGGLEIVAWALESFGHARHAARLLGAGDALRETVKKNRTGLASSIFEKTYAQLQRTLGDQGFEELFHEGKRLRISEALALALADPGE